ARVRAGLPARGGYPALSATRLARALALARGMLRVRRTRRGRARRSPRSHDGVLRLQGTALAARSHVARIRVWRGVSALSRTDDRSRSPTPTRTCPARAARVRAGRASPRSTAARLSDEVDTMVAAFAKDGSGSTLAHAPVT